MNAMLATLKSLLMVTPRRTFLLFPLLTVFAQLVYPVQFGPYNPAALLLLPLGYLQYRLCGSYIARHGRGGHKPRDPPRQLVTSGPYRYVRNPMYLGHIFFLAGIAVALSSFVGLALLIVQAGWLWKNAHDDEVVLLRRYGESFSEYRRAVSGWIPRWRRSRTRMHAV